MLLTVTSVWKLLPHWLPPVAAQLTLPPPLVELLLEDELELLLELEELLELLEDELELDDELELELDDELELLDEEELLELDELLELELLDEPPLPLQVGVTKLPLCVPWKPKVVL